MKSILSFLEILIPVVRNEEGFGWRLSREKMTALVTAALGILVGFGVITPEQVPVEALVGIWAALQAFAASAKRDRQAKP